jgi:hypothetical protein
LKEPASIESDAPALAHGFLAKTFTSLTHRNYRYLWFGTVFMSAGQWIQQVTLGWLVYDLTGSSVLLGVPWAALAQSQPFSFSTAALSISC